jgi:hypothetical protein
MPTDSTVVQKVYAEVLASYTFPQNTQVYKVYAEVVGAAVTATSFALTSAGGTGALGSMGAGQPLSGAAAASAIGSMTATSDATVALSGVSVVGVVQSLIQPGQVLLAGVSGAGGLGALSEGQTLSGVASTSAVGVVSVSADATFALTPVRTATAVGDILTPGSTGTMALSLHVPKLAVVGGGVGATSALTWPTPRLVMFGSPGMVGEVALTLKVALATAGGGNAAIASLTVPGLRLASVGHAGLAGSVALTLPSLHLAMAHASSVALVLGPPRLVINGTTGTLGAVILRLAPLRVAATVVPAFTGTVVLKVASLKLATGALTGSVGVGGTRMVLPRLALAVSGYSGTVGGVELTWPRLRLAATGYQPAIGAVRFTLPRLRLVATGRVAAGTAPLTVAMHTETMALTTYSNYPFNSFATFNGVYLGAAPTGIFALSGANDAGVNIDAAARGGSSDFATSHRKRVDRVYVGYRTDGDMILRVFTDEIHQRDYRLRATGRAGLHGNHVRLGKGLISRYWQFELRNVDGADFQMNMIELEPTTLRRRVGGGDA